MEEMRRQYAVALATDNSTQVLRVMVQNVVDLDDYRAVTAAISSIQTLDDARPVGVQGDILTLELRGVGDAEVLSRLMASGTGLTWVNSKSDSAEGLVLSWQRPE